MVLTARITGLLIAALMALNFVPACAAQPRASVAYVSNEKDGTITVIDTRTDEVISTINIGGRLRGIHLSPDGKKLYVAMTIPSNLRGGVKPIK
jgi:YVTN family beta-propeller protein